MAFRRTVALVAVCGALVLEAAGTARLPGAAAREVDRVSAEALRHDVERLASDAFAGRGVGDQGNRAAETFICDELRQGGVPPAAADGSCFQPFDVYSPRLGPHARLTIASDQDGTLADLAAGRDFYPLPETGDERVSGPLVFVGHGISAPALAHDDYAGVTASGAIVLTLDGASPELLDRPARPAMTSAERERLSSVDRKIADAAAHGARGVLIVQGLDDLRAIWPEHPSVRAAEYRRVSALRARPAPLAAISEQAAAPVRRALDAGRALTAALDPDLVATTVTLHNVLGMVEGRDPSRRGEMVVLGAHLDHDGTDADGRIYNGADDNASGTAAVIAAAAAFARAAADGERPARAVLFALWNGEEKGALGSEAFVDSPQPRRRIVANLNLDMVGRHEEVRDPSDWRFAGFKKVDPASSGNTLHVLGYSLAPELAATLRDANDAIGLTLLEDYDVGAQDLLRRSDQWSFLEHGIPALFLTTGLHPDYHTPDDDTARIDFGKLARVTRLAARAAWLVADGPAPHIAVK